jgi:hypothetical protein
MGYYVVLAPIVSHADGGWKLKPKNMSGHSLAEFIQRYFPDLDLTSTAEYVYLDTEAQLAWQDTGKPYLHDVIDELPYRLGFYVTDDNALLADEFYEDWPLRSVVQED